MCQQTKQRHQRVALITVIALMIAALVSSGSPPQAGGVSGTDRRAGLTSAVRIATEVRLQWTTCSEGHRT